jgi:RNA polymerase sigma-70 factor, ECF subfamily
MPSASELRGDGREGIAVRFEPLRAGRERAVIGGSGIADPPNAVRTGSRPLDRSDLPSGSSNDNRADDELLRRSNLEQLMSAYVAGSERAFDELYRRLTPKVYGYLLRLARKPERAEDLVQVTYSKLHRARGSYLEGAPLLPWVLAIARRAFFDESRALRSRREDLTNEGILPESSATAAEELDTGVLERALAEIPEVYREAIVLTKITGLTVSEAAAVVESTPSAVKLRVHRGYKALRDAMERLSQADAAV